MTQKSVELMISLARADMLVMKIDSPVRLSSYIQINEIAIQNDSSCMI